MILKLSQDDSKKFLLPAYGGLTWGNHVRYDNNDYYSKVISVLGIENLLLMALSVPITVLMQRPISTFVICIILYSITHTFAQHMKIYST